MQARSTSERLCSGFLSLSKPRYSSSVSRSVTRMSRGRGAFGLPPRREGVAESVERSGITPSSMTQVIVGQQPGFCRTRTSAYQGYCLTTTLTNPHDERCLAIEFDGLGKGYTSGKQ